MLSRRRFLVATAAGLASFTPPLAPRARAQQASRPVRIVVGFPVGGPTDVAARLLAEEMRGQYAATVIVENKAGAGGRLAAEHVKLAGADAATILLAPDFTMVVYPHVYKKLAYDPLRDFTPVGAVCMFPLTITVGPAVPSSVKTLGDFLEWCKAHPKQAFYGTNGAGSVPHFTGVLLARASGVELTHVPLKGAGPLMQDVVGGQIPAGILPLSLAQAHIKSGSIRVLATTGPARSRHFPDVPTVKESGFPELEVQPWLGAFVAAGTPMHIVARLNASIGQALKSSRLTDAFEKLGFEIAAGPQEAFAKRVRAEYERWGSVVKASGFSADD